MTKIMDSFTKSAKILKESFTDNFEEYNDIDDNIDAGVDQDYDYKNNNPVPKPFAYEYTGRVSPFCHNLNIQKFYARIL